jgi:hypothetical protein
VGFLAAITGRLADAGISVNPVSAFYHDHLFVPEHKADEALHHLQNMRSTVAAVARMSEATSGTLFTLYPISLRCGNPLKTPPAAFNIKPNDL